MCSFEHNLKPRPQSSQTSDVPCSNAMSNQGLVPGGHAGGGTIRHQGSGGGAPGSGAAASGLGAERLRSVLGPPEVSSVEVGPEVCLSAGRPAPAPLSLAPTAGEAGSD
jgi:hypothetical protein